MKNTAMILGLMFLASPAFAQEEKGFTAKASIWGTVLLPPDPALEGAQVSLDGFFGYGDFPVKFHPQITLTPTNIDSERPVVNLVGLLANFMLKLDGDGTAITFNPGVTFFPEEGVELRSVREITNLAAGRLMFRNKLDIDAPDGAVKLLMHGYHGFYKLLVNEGALNYLALTAGVDIPRAPNGSYGIVTTFGVEAMFF